MKVKDIVELKSRYSFEAPFFSAGVPPYGPATRVTKSDFLDMNAMLAPSPKDTYLVRVTGESMIDAGIYDGDILIVNRRERPRDGKIVIASLNGEMAVKTFRIIKDKVYLYSANSRFLPIEILPYWQFEIQGVVQHVIHNV